jgi:aspartyl-tRNA(Asn)/glutamyl-tRNA(Gln) amidotransferase subunit B
MQEELPELPQAKFSRFVKEYGLPEYDAGILTASRPLTDYFEACVSLFNQPKTVSNWVMGELLRELRQSQTEVDDSPISPEGRIELLRLVEDGTISLKAARDLFPELFSGNMSASELIQAKGLQQVSDEAALRLMVQEVMDNHVSQVEQYRSGKDTVLGFLVGQVMKASGGKANPKKVNELLREALSPVSSSE